ncbi:dihydroxyacetone kinase family protein [Plantactinospora sp. S1510]|uniref:Dihydroxyacetone kinase family protein n=1 Tax=Plantactinospora alkalitolerans TaxID=2789879 RepID=A0ABS0GT41_9ACTN|nr:dihydroxyacetone kinase family protein [Plantactinospora alkalitolerans]MBF9129363.1 dihydroxyacetone kinase family protein [Plantactinospora alkalitolerans]
MTRLYDDPASFTEDMLAGFLDLHRRYVRGVDGGVVRAGATRAGKVAVVVGGGSGHYPAFCGVVGPGFADGAVVGNIFTSPSAQQAYEVARAADNGGGVLFLFGNYAGDVMNFGLAQQRLRAEGIDTRTVLVTDDIASAVPAEADKRRGIAGDFVVFKTAAAAAEAGYPLAEVERVAQATNALTRSLGVAFAGCTLPGQDHPLFTVPAGTMGLGLGIHGEPGVSSDDLPTASELARVLARGVLAERPEGAGHRVAAILNGLGATKYEELFVVWKTVAEELSRAGLEVVDPEVGELVTSLDMAGCSLTLCWLDEELEGFWCAPADTPAYRKNPHRAAPIADGTDRAATGSDSDSSGQVVAGSANGGQVVADTANDGAGTARSSSESRAYGRSVAEVFAEVAEAIAAAEDELGRLDAVAGDGDHGRGMLRGVRAAAEAARGTVDGGGGVASVLGAAGDAWAARAGGTSGVLWGAALRSAGEQLGDERSPLGTAEVRAAVWAAIETVQGLGGAEPGDKTLLDALMPFHDALDTAAGSGTPLGAAWQQAAEVADRAADATAGLRPRIGRARPLAERSVGTPDPGAVSLALCLRTVATAFERHAANRPEVSTVDGRSGR